MDVRALVIDPTLTGPLSLVTDFASLKEHGVEKVYIFNEEPPLDYNGLLYLCRPQPKLMKILAKHVKHYRQLNGRSCSLHLLVVPRKTAVCERILEEEGVLGDIVIGEYEMGFIQLDQNLFSMELDSSFNDLYVNNDHNCLYDIARAFICSKKLSIDGRVPRIAALGKYSQTFSEILSRNW